MLNLTWMPLFHDEISAGSVGAVIRDHQGNFLGAKCVYLSHVTSVVMVKALAMREGLFVASSMGYSSIQVDRTLRKLSKPVRKRKRGGTNLRLSTLITLT
jgi:hypothetical protein